MWAWHGNYLLIDLVAERFDTNFYWVNSVLNEIYVIYNHVRCFKSHAIRNDGEFWE